VEWILPTSSGGHACEVMGANRACEITAFNSCKALHTDIASQQPRQTIVDIINMCKTVTNKLHHRPLQTPLTTLPSPGDTMTLPCTVRVPSTAG
jgi:hypothetical protein